MKLALSTPLNSVAVGFDIPATAERDSMLAVASFVQVVEDADSFDGAVNCLREINGFLKQLEEDRKAVKGPVTDLGRRIDNSVAEFGKGVEIEKDRISKLINSYQSKIALAKAAAEMEQRRQQEAVLAEQRAQQAEIDRRARSALQASKNDAERVAAQARAEADRARLEEETAQAQAALMTPAVLEAPKPEGTATRRPWKYEVTNISVLYAARPELVKLEPRGREILVEIAKGKPIPGLKAWQETEVTVRT